MDKILEGVVIGIVIALVLGAYDWFKRKLRQKEQIRHIRRIIKDAEQKIRQAKPLTLPESTDLQPSLDQVRFVIYKAMMRDITVVLEDRAGELSYTQKHDLKYFIVGQDAITSILPQNKIPSEIKFYEEHVFKRLYSLKWLELTK